MSSIVQVFCHSMQEITSWMAPIINFSQDSLCCLANGVNKTTKKQTAQFKKKKSLGHNFEGNVNS